ncbi:hypothetical protein G6F63_014808 [Rhizopus arrhizus]|nr:hypothetical protein G6F63_014808 [Rhizopus arrhizus]
MPPITPVPMAWRELAPAPVEIAIGITPMMNANDVIRTGRKRRRAASMVASRRFLPAARCSTANSTIRIAFLAASPMMVIRPTLKYTSFDMPRALTSATAPSMPSGTTSMTEIGMAQLSYSAANTRNTISSDRPIRMGAWLPAWRS